jgi:hypothetical protein
MNQEQHRQDQELRQRLNLETSRLSWQDLQRHYAGGNVVAVAGELDLIEVAVCMTHDDTAAFRGWLETGLVTRVSDALAAAWLAQDAELWAVVIKPWVLVQLAGKASA